MFSVTKVSEPMTTLDCGFVLPESVRQELLATLQEMLDNFNRFSESMEETRAVSKVEEAMVREKAEALECASNLKIPASVYDMDSHVKEMEEFSHQSTNGSGKKIAHQLFDQMPSKEKQRKCLKAWKFKFKPTSKRSKTMDVKFFSVEEIAWLTKESKEINRGCVSKEFKEAVAGCEKKKKGLKSWMFKYKKGNKKRDLLLLNGKASLALRAIGTGLETVERDSSNQEKSKLCTEDKGELKGCLERLQASVLLKEESESMVVNEVKAEFKTFDKKSSNKTLSLEDEQDDEHEQNQVIKLISSLKNRIWEPGGVLIEHDRWLSNSIGCELETGETVSDEYRVPSDLLLLSEKDSLAVSAIGSKLETDLSDQERNGLCTKNKESEVEVDVWIQEQVENHSMDSVLQPSLVPQMCSLLKEQVHEAREENSTFEIHKNLVQQVLLEEDSTTKFHEPVSKSENLRKMKVNSLLNNIEAVVAVVERSRQVSVTKYFWSRSENWKKHKTMQLQVILNMLFVKIRRESQKILSIVKLLFQNSLVHHQQTVNADDEKHIMVCVDKSDGQLFWMVFVRKPAIRAVQRIWEKETHDVDIIDANSVLQEEFEQVVNHTPFSVIKLEGLLLLGDESFQIKHKWRFKLLPLILECEIYSDRLVLVTNSAQQFDISDLMILMTVGTLFTNLRSQLLFKALKRSIQ